MLFFRQKIISSAAHRNEFIRDLINSTHAGRRVRKGQFETQKQEKGRKFGAHREQVPRKQGLKQISASICAFSSLIESKFHENKD